MKFIIQSPSKKATQHKAFDIEINAEHEAHVVLQQFQEIWSWLVDDRQENRPILGTKANRYYHGYTIKDADSFKAVATSINAENLFLILIRLNNAYVPLDIGRIWLQNVFYSSTICISQIRKDVTAEEELVKPLLPDRYGVFNYTFYTNKDWTKYSAMTISGTGTFINYPYADFSELAKGVYSDRGIGKRPFIWVNPKILQCFIDARNFSEADIIPIDVLQYAISHYILCMILTHKGKVRESGAKEIWSVVEFLCKENKKLDEILASFVMTAEDLIAKHTPSLP